MHSDLINCDNLNEYIDLPWVNQLDKILVFSGSPLLPFILLLNYVVCSLEEAENKITYLLTQS